MGGRLGNKVSAFFNTMLHIVRTKSLKETEHAVSLIDHRWEKTSHHNKFTEVECVVTHEARMCDPGGVCGVGGINAICHFTAVGLLPCQQQCVPPKQL